MKIFVVALCAIGIISCAQQRVVDSLNDAAAVEGREYAAEMAAQSPFDTVEMKWSDAARQMEKRNPAYLAARQIYEQSAAENSEVRELTSEIRRSVTSSVGGVLNPGAVLESMRNPAIELPKQIASIGGIKDISHNVNQNAWQGASAAVDAKLAMRRERVKLHRLLRTGAQLDHEISLVEKSTSATGKDADPELGNAMREWRGELRDARETWLSEVRDFFDAEYHDVRFIADASGLPTYRNVDQPELEDWERWCQLVRSKELVDTLAKSHAENKPAVPGTTMVTSTLGNLVGGGDDEPDFSPAIRESSAVRREVRTLVQSWRNMKRAQTQAARLESAEEATTITSVADVTNRRKIHQLRTTEIENAAKVWMMDETCWE